MNPFKPNTSENIIAFAAIPVMQVELDLDVNKLTEFVFQIQNKDKKGVHISNKGGWQSGDISGENHKEFIKLKEKIKQNIQTYYERCFRGVEFKYNAIFNSTNMWVNINEKHHYNDWHVHAISTLSGVFYIKHDGSKEHGDIAFKHPNYNYMRCSHWPPECIEAHNEFTTEVLEITPTPNLLIIFPSWAEHKVETNLKTDSRISLSFNVSPIVEIRPESNFHNVQPEFVN